MFRMLLYILSFSSYPFARLLWSSTCTDTCFSPASQVQNNFLRTFPMEGLAFPNGGVCQSLFIFSRVIFITISRMGVIAPRTLTAYATVRNSIIVIQQCIKGYIHHLSCSSVRQSMVHTSGEPPQK